jgi:hypothetical protein
MEFFSKRGGASLDQNASEKREGVKHKRRKTVYDKNPPKEEKNLRPSSSSRSITILGTIGEEGGLTGRRKEKASIPDTQHPD